MLFWAQRPRGALQICLAGVCVAYVNRKGRTQRDSLGVTDPPWTRGSFATCFSGGAIRSPSRLRGRKESVLISQHRPSLIFIVCCGSADREGCKLTLKFLWWFIHVMCLRHTATLFKHSANYSLPSLSQYPINSGKEILPGPSLCMGETLTAVLQFSLDAEGKSGFGNLFTLSSCREFKQTNNFVCTGVTSAYFPIKEKEAHLPRALGCNTGNAENPQVFLYCPTDSSNVSWPLHSLFILTWHFSLLWDTTGWILNQILHQSSTNLH